MTARLRWLVLAAVLVAGAFTAVYWAFPDYRPGGNRPRAKARTKARAHEKAAPHPQLAPGGYDRVVVEVEIPAAEEPELGPDGSPVEKKKGCAMTQVCNILEVTLSNPHGIIIKEVLPGGPADGAGIKPGDALCDPTECPRVFLPAVDPGPEPRTVKIAVSRPKEPPQAK